MVALGWRAWRSRACILWWPRVASSVPCRPLQVLSFSRTRFI